MVTAKTLGFSHFFLQLIAQTLFHKSALSRLARVAIVAECKGVARAGAWRRQRPGK